MQNVVALYGLQVATYVAPVVTVPYLARVLGPAQWGLVAFAQGLAFYFTVIVEFGFMFSATREVARNRDSHEELEKIASGVFGAKVVLVGVVLASAWCIRHLLPAFRQNPALLWGAVLWAVSQGLSVSWYFQGIEQMRVSSAVEIGGKIAGAVLTFALVKTSHDGWKVLPIFGAAMLAAVCINLALMYREVRFRWPSIPLVKQTIRAASSLFLFRAAISLYTAGNAFLLGLFAGPTTVAYFAGPEKITRVLMGFFAPMSQAIYPRLSSLVRHAPTDAVRLARVGATAMITVGGLMSLMLFFCAPLIVRVALGPQFQPAVPVLRILSLLPPLVALGTAVGLLWMLPLGFDRAYNAILLAAGGVNLVAAVILATRFAETGMGGATVVCEGFVALTTYLFLRHRGLDPLMASRKPPARASADSDRGFRVPDATIADRIRKLQMQPELRSSR